MLKSNRVSCEKHNKIYDKYCIFMHKDYRKKKKKRLFTRDKKNSLNFDYVILKTMYKILIYLIYNLISVWI